MTASAQSASTKEIWKQLVEYANADFNGNGEPSLEREFLTLHQACIQWIAPAVGMVSRSMPHVFSQGIKDANEGGPPISVTARENQTEIRRVLQWLIEPEQSEANQAEKAFRYLESCIESIRWERLFNKEFNPIYRKGAFWIDYPANFGHVMSPMCEFIWRQMERYRAGDGELKQLIPIDVCRRPSCGRFFLIERIGRGSYCSGLCRASHWQSTHPEERRERERERQLRKKQRELKKADIGRAKSKRGRK